MSILCYTLIFIINLFIVGEKINIGSFALSETIIVTVSSDTVSNSFFNLLLSKLNITLFVIGLLNVSSIFVLVEGPFSSPLPFGLTINSALA